MELKLRAWDGEEFLYSEDCNSLREFFDRTEERGSFGTVYQLFIGLQDENGKDIYRGDITEIKIDDEVVFYEIVFREDYLMFDGKSHKKGYLFDLESEFLTHYTCKVIGNIFKNPKIMSDILSNNKPDLSTER